MFTCEISESSYGDHLAERTPVYGVAVLARKHKPHATLLVQQINI